MDTATGTGTPDRTAPIVKFVQGRLQDGRIRGKYAGRGVEAWVEPANPPDRPRHRFVVEYDTGAKGGGWTYRGGGTWTRPHDHRTAPTLVADAPDLLDRLEAAGLRPLLATLDLYRPELRFDADRGRLLYTQAIPGEPHFPPSDTFAQILSVLRAVAEANKRAQRGK